MSDRIDAWFAQAVGKAMNLDGVPKDSPLQCVDVPNDLAEFLFGNWEKTIGRGDAKDKYDIAPSAYWEKLPYRFDLVPQKGDVVVWPGSSIVPAGHTAVVESATAGYMNVVEQSGGTERAAYRASRLYRLNGVLPIGYLRPRATMIKGVNIMSYRNYVLICYALFQPEAKVTDATINNHATYLASVSGNLEAIKAWTRDFAAAGKGQKGSLIQDGNEQFQKAKDALKALQQALS